MASHILGIYEFDDCRGDLTVFWECAVNHQFPSKRLEGNVPRSIVWIRSELPCNNSLRILI